MATVGKRPSFSVQKLTIETLCPAGTQLMSRLKKPLEWPPLGLPAIFKLGIPHNLRHEPLSCLQFNMPARVCRREVASPFVRPRFRIQSRCMITYFPAPALNIYPPLYQQSKQSPGKHFPNPMLPFEYSIFLRTKFDNSSQWVLLEPSSWRRSPQPPSQPLSPPQQQETPRPPPASSASRKCAM